MIVILKDLTGKRFGRLFVVGTAPRKNNRTAWRCRCDCGNYTDVLASNLTTGNTKSCRCLEEEKFYGPNDFVFKPNLYSLGDKVSIGYCAGGKIFLFDTEDYDKIKKYHWCSSKGGYISTRIDGKTVLFHRFILGVKQEEEVDHIEGRPWDNRKEKLRIASHQENMMNRKKSIKSTTGVTGVSIDKRTGKFRAEIHYHGRKYSLGCYKTLEKAKQARTQAEEKFFKDYARKENFR